VRNGILPISPPIVLQAHAVQQPIRFPPRLIDELPSDDDSKYECFSSLSPEGERMKREREIQELKDRILALEMMKAEEDYQRQIEEDALLAQQLSSNPDMPASYKDAVLSGQEDDVRAKFAQEYSVAPRASQPAVSQTVPRASQPAVSQTVPRASQPVASQAVSQSNSVVIVLIGKTENMIHKTYMLVFRDVKSQHFGLPNAAGTHSQNDATKLLVRKTNHLLYVKPTCWKQYITGKTTVNHLMVDEPSLQGFQYTRYGPLCREMGKRGLSQEWRENILTMVDFVKLGQDLLHSSGSFSTKDIEGQTITIDEMSCDLIRDYYRSYSVRNLSMMPTMYFVPSWNPHREFEYASPQETTKFEKLRVYTVGH
jgi:hypothetical protein